LQLPITQIRPLFKKAVALDREGDIYTAVKIYKKLIKIAPEWYLPYQYLSVIYKYNNDWKAAFYYGKTAIEKGADQEDIWRNFAIAATALKKWEIARTAWNKVGYQLREVKKAPNFDMGLIPIRLKYDNFYEIVWAKQIDPARAIIESIPDPVSDRNYGDLVLIDYKVTGYRIVKGKKYLSTMSWHSLNALTIANFWYFFLEPTDRRLIYWIDFAGIRIWDSTTGAI